MDRQKLSNFIGYIGLVLMLPGASVFWISCWLASTREGL
jgi:hypothetical protein